jgi:exodeoxyribonuclease V alpha subunit
MQTETIRGTVRRVFFSNSDTCFMAGVLAPEDGAAEVRFSGKCVAQVGDKLEITGAWGVHERFGRQFNAETGRVKMDDSPEALAHLLASDSRFKGLGPARARRVVEAALRLGADGDIANALATYTAQIAEAAGCPLEIVQNAAQVWNSKRSYFDALALLCDQGWSNAQAQTIMHVFGENAPAMVKRDPYMLIGKIPRFGFRTVDAVARQMGVAANDPGRLAAGVAYCLDQMGGSGDTWTTREGLIGAAILELRPDTLDGEDRIKDSLEQLIASGLVHVDIAPNGDEVVADARMAEAEFDVFRRLLAGLQANLEALETGALKFDGPRAQAVLQTLNKDQAKAVWGFVTHLFSVITGGAGVGKTYTMNAVCEISEENLLQVELCAPTGKAARKLSHATQRPAKTIHRLLEPSYDEMTGRFRFLRGPENPLDVDLVIVDEVSMVDIKLMRSLLLALPKGCRLLMVGDHHQIPSVSPGAILRDLLTASSPAIHVLREIVRQAGDLARNTTAILDGVVVATNNEVWGIEPTEKGSEEAAASVAAQLIEALATAAEPLAPFGRLLDFAWDIQVLAPQRKGQLGTYALNVELQKLRQRLLGNPVPELVKDGERPKPLVGDRIIWTKNDYQLDLFNGTQAIVTGFGAKGSMHLYTEDGREVEIPGDKRNNVEVAYAMTIHKAQGSEWPFVLLVASSSHWNMHDRNLLYTGCSRAAEALIILGDRSGLRHFAQERKSATRQTFGSFLVHGWQPRAALASSLGTTCAQPISGPSGGDVS